MRSRQSRPVMIPMGIRISGGDEKQPAAAAAAAATTTHFPPGPSKRRHPRPLAQRPRLLYRWRAVAEGQMRSPQSRRVWRTESAAAKAGTAGMGP